MRKRKKLAALFGLVQVSLLGLKSLDLYNSVHFELVGFSKKISIWSIALVCAPGLAALLVYLIVYTSTVAHALHLQQIHAKIIAFALLPLVLPCFFMFFKLVVSEIFTFIKNTIKPPCDTDICLIHTATESQDLQEEKDFHPLDRTTNLEEFTEKLEKLCCSPAA